jgi:hypothetical protein
MKKIMIILSFLFFPSLLLANGSPINLSEVYGTGNIEMMKKKNITLEEETLSVVIDGDFADVKVEYKFKNNGKADTVAYGFPIDRYYEGEAVPNLSEKSLINFKIEDSSGFLKFFEFISKTEEEVVDLGFDNYGKRLREWFISEIPFKENETKIVKISYRVKSYLDDMVYSKSFRPEFSNRTFIYLLKPSQNWGDGIVKHCTIQIDFQKILQHDGVIKEIYPTGYVKKEDKLVWEYSNLDLKTAADIQVVYDNSASAMTKYVSEERISIKYISSMKASSILKANVINKNEYKLKNLFDDNLSTAWCEGAKGHGEGEWIEINFKNNVVISAIGIINGYTKSDDLYKTNNRIKKIKLDIESVEAEPKSETIELKQKQFNDLNKNSRAPFINWLADYGDGFGSVKKVRLTILEVFPGTKYDDSCISELYLLGGIIPEQ